MRLISALAQWVATSARSIVIVAFLLLVVAAVFGAGVNERLSTGGNLVPTSDSTLANEMLRDVGGTPNVVVLITESGALSPRSTQAAADVVAVLNADPDTTVLASAWLTDEPALRSVDGQAGLILASVPGGPAEVEARSSDLADQIHSLEPPPGVVIEVGGDGPALSDLVATTDADLLRAELIAVPLTVLALLFIFRTPVAAALPLVVAAVAVVGTFALLRVLTSVVEVSIFARNVATALGLAVAVDSTLFLVSRYREHRHEYHDARDAVRVSLEQAGPSILFSGLTTAAGMAGLLLFDIPLLRSFAYSGVAVILLAMVGALIVLPAVMTLLGDRLDRWTVRAIPASAETGLGWYRLAKFIMSHPRAIGGFGLAVLVLAASPFARLDFGLLDDRVLPPDVESRQVLDAVREDFGALEGGVISIAFKDPQVLQTLAAADGADEGGAGQADLERYASAIQGLPGVSRVEWRTGWLAVIPSIEPVSAEGSRLVEAIRAEPAPSPVLVGGEAARLVDNTSHVGARLPWALGSMVIATLILLSLLFRSVLLPIKAVILNLLSLSVMFGAVVWIFQDGRFSGFLGYTPTGLTDVTIPMLMFGVAFGLSMDYEVFLLSRIRDEYADCGDTVEATARGLQRTGGILSASAILMSVVFLSFATSSVAHLKVLGVGITLAVLVDAFVVRTLLVPSFMATAGRANWWPGQPTVSTVGEADDQTGFDLLAPSPPSEQFRPAGRPEPSPTVGR